MRILVCGGRDYENREHVSRVLASLGKITEIIEGGAKGTDKLAKSCGIEMGIPVRTFPANWVSYGKKAGPIRNYQMLKEGKPDLVLAFPGSKGTAHMVKIAKEANIPVKEVTDD